jgi:MinD-like ATPase involved in chromosome partitioning or flagellar assembly
VQALAAEEQANEPAEQELAPRSASASGVWHKRAFDATGQSPQRQGPDIWAVAGGKGGVGKSVIAANLALAVAKSGLSCLLVDGDLGAGNQHTLFGEQPRSQALEDFLAGEAASLEAVCKPSRFPGLSLAFTQCDVVGAANPKHSQKQKLLRHLSRADCDVVVLDLGAGTSFNTLDLFLAARVRLVVTTPEPTSVQNAYGFIKCAAARERARDPSAELAPRILVNLADEHEAQHVFQALSSVTSSFLGRAPAQGGWVRKDPAMAHAVTRSTPVLSLSPSSVSSRDLAQLSQNLLEERFERRNHSGYQAILARGLNEELRIAGRLLHVQTEDLGQGKGQIRTQVFEAGRVVFSKALPYGVKLADGRVLSRQQQVEYQHRVIAKALIEQRIG